MPSIERSIDVDVPVRAAYALWADPESWPLFRHEIAAATRAGDGVVRCRPRFGDYGGEYEVVFTEQAPPQRFGWMARTGPVENASVGFFYLDETRTRVTLRLATEPEAAGGQPDDEEAVERLAVRDLQDFARVAEQRGWSPEDVEVGLERP